SWAGFGGSGNGVEVSGLAIRPPPVTRKPAAAPAPLETSGRTGAFLGGVESLQATTTRAAATTPDTPSLDPNMTSASRSSDWRATVLLSQRRCHDIGRRFPRDVACAPTSGCWGNVRV